MTRSSRACPSTASRFLRLLRAQDERRGLNSLDCAETSEYSAHAERFLRLLRQTVEGSPYPAHPEREAVEGSPYPAHPERQIVEGSPYPAHPEREAVEGSNTGREFFHYRPPAAGLAPAMSPGASTKARKGAASVRNTKRVCGLTKVPKVSSERSRR